MSSRKASALQIGDWYIFRLDENNIVVVKDIARDDLYRYFPNMRWALEDVLHQLISTSEAKTVEELLQAIRKAETSIVNALARAGMPR